MRSILIIPRSETYALSQDGGEFSLSSNATDSPLIERVSENTWRVNVEELKRKGKKTPVRSIADIAIRFTEFSFNRLHSIGGNEKDEIESAKIL